MLFTFLGYKLLINFHSITIVDESRSELLRTSVNFYTFDDFLFLVEPRLHSGCKPSTTLLLLDFACIFSMVSPLILVDLFFWMGSSGIRGFIDGGERFLIN